jgi:hypothetical protein
MPEEEAWGGKSMSGDTARSRSASNTRFVMGGLTCVCVCVCVCVWSFFFKNIIFFQFLKSWFNLPFRSRFSAFEEWDPNIDAASRAAIVNMLDEDRGSTPFYRAWARPVRARALSSSSRQPTTRASATSSLNARSDLARSADARSVETRSIYARSTDGRSADARSLYARSIEGRSDAASDAVSSEAAPQNMFDGGGGSGGGGDGGGGSGRGGGSERRSAHDHINVGRARRVTSASVSFADGTRGGGESEDLDDDDDDDGDDNPGGRGGARSTLLGGGGGHCRGDHGGGGGGDKNRGRSRFYQHDVRRGASPGEVNNNGNGGRGTSRSVRSGGSGRGILVGIGRGGSVGRIVPGGSDDSEAGSIDVIGYSSNEDPVARLCGGRREQSERLADTPVTVGTGDGDMDAL